MTVRTLSERSATVRSTPADEGAQRPGTQRLPQLLGWVSLGLSASAVLPEQVAALAGLGTTPRARAVAQAAGVRELVHAAGLVRGRHPRWVLTRVAGDAMDLAVLVHALRREPPRTRAWRRSSGEDRERTVVTTAVVAGITLLDLYAARRVRRAGRRTEVEMIGAVTINKTPDEVYAAWRRLEDLPKVLAHVEKVRERSGGRTHWTVTGPFGSTVEWDATITDDRPGERLAWRSLPGARVENEGRVAFTPAPGDRGTEMRAVIRYAAPGGKLGAALARFAGEDPHQQLDDDLRRFKQVVETGEVVRSEGAPYGKRARKEFPQHAAQPLSARELADLHREESRR